jgi:hypothetical protein
MYVAASQFLYGAFWIEMILARFFFSISGAHLLSLA